MRYRSLNQTGATASAVSLILPDVNMREAERIKMIHAALESGINTFEIQSQNPEIGAALAKGLGDLDRRLITVALRLTWSRRAEPGQPSGSAAIAQTIEAMAEQTGLRGLDLAIIDAPDAEPPPPEAIAVLQSARAQGLVSRLGVAGEGEVVQEHIRSGKFDALAMRFNVHSGWAARNRVRDASSRDMAVIGYDRYPSRQALGLPAALARTGGLLARLLTGKPAPEKVGTTSYAFLNDTPGWTAEEVCLAYALTEPALTTVQIDPVDVAALKALAQVPDRELPSGLAAQIEMARFSNLETESAVDKRRLRA